MPLVDQHPPCDELESFALGRLADTRFDSVEEHVAACADCEGVISRIAGDTFTELLRSAQSLSDTPRPLAAEATAVEPRSSADGGTSPWSGAVVEGRTDVPEVLANHPRYQALRLLGSGGMGTVWLAEHGVMGRQVAVKVIRPEFIAKAGVAERFRREAQAAARLTHPNIVAAFDAEQAGDTQLLAMEYIQGVNLADEIRRRGPLPVAEACDVVRQAAIGLQHAFECGLIHRDLKPHNLMRTADGTVKILDFGLAVLADTGERKSGLTGQNVVLGTPDYIAPEQAEDSHAADVRSDVYSLGCTLYHLLTGRVPFPGDSVLRKLDAHRTQEPPPIRTSRPEIPTELTAIVTRMMAKKPADRFQTPAAVAVALAPFVAGTMPVRQRRRTWIAAAAALLCAAFLAAAGVVFKIQRDNQEITIATNDDDIEVVIKRKGDLVRIRDPKSGQTWELNTLTNEIGFVDQPDGLRLRLPEKEPFVLRRRGKEVFTVSREAKPQTRVALVEPLHKIAWPECVDPNDCDVTPDGRYVLVVAMHLGQARVWDAVTGRLVHEFSDASCAGFTPDGRQVVVTAPGEEQDFRVYDLATGKLERRFGAGIAAWDFEFSANGARLLRVSDTACEVWDFASGKRLCELPYVYGDAVMLTPDGHHVLRQEDGKPPLLVYDVATGKPSDAFAQLRDIPSLGTWWPSMSTFSADGRRVLTVDGHSLKLFDVATGKPVTVIKDVLEQWALLTPDGRRLLGSGIERNACGVWDAETGRPIAKLHLSEKWDGRAWCRTSRDGRTVVTCQPSGNVYVFRLPEATAPASKPETEKVGQVHVFPGHLDAVHGLAVSRDGRYAVSGGGYKFRDGKWVDGAKDFDIRVWDLMTRTELRRLPGSGAPVWSLALSPDGRRVLSGGGNPEGAIRLLDFETGKELIRSEPRESEVWSLAVSPDGRYSLDAANEANEFQLRDVETGKVVRRFEGHTKIVCVAIFSPDGRRALSCSIDGTARLWDVKTGKELRQYKGQDAIYTVAFSPDGNRLLTGGTDCIVRLWDTETGQELRRLEGHKAEVSALAFSPGGRFALSAGGSKDGDEAEDFSVRLWDLDSGKELHRFDGHTDVVSQVIWLPDGRHALSCGWDKTVRLWRLPELQNR